MYLNKLYEFVNQREGKFPWSTGFSSEQRVAMSAFANWLDQEAAQQQGGNLTDSGTCEICGFPDGYHDLNLHGR
jgi:hypothetical protein